MDSRNIYNNMFTILRFRFGNIRNFNNIQFSGWKFFIGKRIKMV